MKKIFLIFIIFINLFLVKNTFAGTYTISPISTSNISSYLNQDNLFFNEGFLNIPSSGDYIYIRDYNGNIIDTYNVSDFDSSYCSVIYKGFLCYKGFDYFIYIDIFDESNSILLDTDYIALGMNNYLASDENKRYYILYHDSGYTNILNIKTKKVEYSINHSFYANWCYNNYGFEFPDYSFTFYNSELVFSCEGDFMEKKLFKISDKTEIIINDFDGIFNYKNFSGIRLGSDFAYGTNLKINFGGCYNSGVCFRKTPDGFYSPDFTTYYERYSNSLVSSQVLTGAGSFAYCKKPYFGVPTLTNGSYVCEAPDPPPLTPPPPPSGALNPSGALYPIEPGTPSGSVCANLKIIDNNNIFFTWDNSGVIPPTDNSPYDYGSSGYKICSYNVSVSMYNTYTNLKNKKCPLNDTIFISAVNQGTGDILPFYTMSCVYGLSSTTAPTPPEDPTPPTPPEDPTTPTPPEDPTPPTPPVDPTPPTPPVNPTPPTPPEEPTEPESTSFIGSALSYIGDKIGNAFSFIGDMFAYIGDKIGNAVQWVGDKLGYIGDKLGNAFGFIGDMLGYIGDKLGNAFGFIGDMLGYIGDKLGGAFTYIGEVILSVFEGIGSGISKIGDFFSYIMGLFTSLGNAVNTFWDFLKSIMKIGQISFIPNAYADVSPIANLLNSGTTSFLKGETEEVEIISDIVKTMKWGIFFIFIILILSIFFIVAYNQKK